jgi:hypothetical protein
LQYRIQEDFPEHKVDLDEAKFFWVTGFTQVNDRSESYQNGDDVAVAAGGGQTWCCRINESVVVVAGELIFYFSFVYWYNRLDRSAIPRPVAIQNAMLVEKWTGNNLLNLPMSPSKFRERIFVTHFCVRWCSREPPCGNPTLCICNAKCRTMPFCFDHKSFNCEVQGCLGTKPLMDHHNDAINEYLIFDSRHGYQSDM